MLERLRAVPLLFWLAVILPTALAQTGFGAAQEGNNTIIEYLRSRQAIAESNQDGLLTKAYSAPQLFFWDRFGAIGGTSDEEFFEYFGGKMSVDEGATTQVLTITVRAFDPDQAQLINQRLVTQSETLVNSLAERAREDSIVVAEEELEAAKEEARSAALALATFRDRNGIVDPEQESEVGLQMISKLQDELIGRASLSSSMAKYQELQLNSQLADKQLAVVLAGLQEARGEARRKRVYVEQVAKPSLPDYPTEPRRLRSILATLVMGLLAWGVFTMLVIGVREHRD